MVAYRHIALTQTDPPGPSVYCHLLGDSTLTRSGGGGWQVVDRPKREATTEWVDFSPFTMTLPLMLDGTDFPGGQWRPIDAGCNIVESWELPTPATLQPPVLRMQGPVPRTNLLWVAKAVKWGNALRDPASGARVQQEFTLTLLEYAPPTVALRSNSPAHAAQQRQATSPARTAAGTRTYTVRAGDTLSGIAVRMLGDYRRYSQIAALNGVRDPNFITVGQVLRLPPG